MTVLVGVLCEGGVVVGTDSSATLGTPFGRTVEQPTRKITIVDDSVIVAGTGEVGLDQRFVQVVQRFQESDGFRQAASPVEVAKTLAAQARTDFDSTGAFKQRQDGSGTFFVVDYGAMVAFWHGGRGYLVEFGVGAFQPELKKEDGLWYVSMGSGQQIADPFLGMMRKTFCEGGCPQLPIARFITCWALSHTIDLNTGGINGPLCVAVLSKESGRPVARYLSEEELQDHGATVEAAYRYLSKFPETFEQPSESVPT